MPTAEFRQVGKSWHSSMLPLGAEKILLPPRQRLRPNRDYTHHPVNERNRLISTVEHRHMQQWSSFDSIRCCRTDFNEEVYRVPTKNHILADLSESDKTQFGKEDFAQQSTPQKMFSSIWALESEVCNGGFSQYFLNSSCETASLVSEALETIGAPKTAVICRRAIAAAFPTGLPERREDISAAAADFSNEVIEALEPLTIEFFKCPDNLADLLFACVSNHPEEFGELPKADD